MQPTSGAHALAVLSTLFYLQTIYAKVLVNYVQRDHRPVCTTNEVCADIWHVMRRREGISVPERRHILNCDCEGEGRMCDWMDEATPNSVFQSTIHQEVLCRQIDRICDPGEVARVYVQPEMRERRPYFEVNCLCAGHDSNQQRAYDSTIIDRSTDGMYNATRHAYITEYYCNVDQVATALSSYNFGRK